MPKDIMVIDVGGTHIKIKSSNLDERRSIDSGSKMSASRAVNDIKRLAHDWTYSAVSIGIPAPVIHGHILQVHSK